MKEALDYQRRLDYKKLIFNNEIVIEIWGKCPDNIVTANFGHCLYHSHKGDHYAYLNGQNFVQINSYADWNRG